MDRGQRLAVKASRLAPRGRRTGVTGASCWIWIESARGGGGFEEQGAGGVADFRPWPEFLQITEVHACYLFYCKRHSYPRPVPSSALGKRLNELLPSTEKRKVTISNQRKNAYLFTSLDLARDEFAQVNRLTSIRWAEDEELRLQQVS